MAAPSVARVRVFFAVTLALTWVTQLPAVLAKLGVIRIPVDSLMPLGMIGVFAPSAVALALARGEPGGARGILRSFAVRTNPGWLLLALSLPAVLLALGLVLYAAVSGYDGAWLYPPDNAQRIVALVLMSVVEEIGWRGYALPRLQAQQGALRASVDLGIAWSLWHLPMFLLAGMPGGLMALMPVFFVAGSVVYTWLYNRSGGSLLVAVFAHVSAHLNNSHASLPGDPVPALVHTGMFAAVALVMARDLARRPSLARG